MNEKLYYIHIRGLHTEKGGGYGIKEFVEFFRDENEAVAFAQRHRTRHEQTYHVFELVAQGNLKPELHRPR